MESIMESIVNGMTADGFSEERSSSKEKEKRVLDSVSSVCRQLSRKI